MFTFSESKASSKSQPRPSLRFWTFNGWSGTIERVRALGALPAKPRKAILWLHRSNNNPSIQNVERPKTAVKQPLPLDSFPFPSMVAPMSAPPAEVVEASVPVHDVGTGDHPGFRPFRCTKLVLVASTDASRPCRIRRINTRKELPWIPISKPLPPVPSSPDPKTRPVTDTSSLLPYSQNTTSRNSLDTFDDGLDDLSLFLRRIAYDVISASTIHRHLGFMEDGGRVLPLGRTTCFGRRSISPPRRYSSLLGVSLAIMEGRLPKALMVV